MSDEPNGSRAVRAEHASDAGIAPIPAGAPTPRPGSALWRLWSHAALHLEDFKLLVGPRRRLEELLRVFRIQESMRELKLTLEPVRPSRLLGEKAPTTRAPATR